LFKRLRKVSDLQKNDLHAEKSVFYWVVSENTQTPIYPNPKFVLGQPIQKLSPKLPIGVKLDKVTLASKYDGE